MICEPIRNALAVAALIAALGTVVVRLVLSRM